MVEEQGFRVVEGGGDAADAIVEVLLLWLD